MFKHLSKENFKIFFEALKKEPPSLIFKNAMNKLRGKTKAAPSVEAFNFLEKDGISFKITSASYISPKECEIIGWISSADLVKRLNYASDTGLTESIKLKKANKVDELGADEDQRFNFKTILSTFGAERQLSFEVATENKKVVIDYDISQFLNSGAISTQIISQYHYPNTKWHKNRSKNKIQLSEEDPKLICFYLPQYHRIPENDKWWGVGFTEWTNVTKAVPKFEYHYQPRLPADLGFYDLNNPEVMKSQIEMAQQYGIYGFCFHYYWFGGKKILEMPINQFRDNKSHNFKYCINWANENWTRAWDGAEDNVLLKQDYNIENIKAFYQDLKSHFQDDRYIKIDSKPMLLIYRPLHNPNIKKWKKGLENLAKEDGFNGIHFVACQSIENLDDPSAVGMDKTAQFPPHHMATLNPTLKEHGYSLDHIKTLLPQLMYNNAFKGSILNYSDIALCSYNYKSPDFEYESVFPAWDNCARKNNFGTPFVFSTPKKYGVWLNNCLNRTKDKEEKIVFINAWNEWAEGAYLEPDRHFGYAYLQATAEVLALHTKETSNKSSFPITPYEKSSDIAIVIHLYYTEMWDEIVEYLNKLNTKFDLYITLTESKSDFRREILKHDSSINVIIVQNKGRDVGPFFETMSKITPLEYKYIAKLHSKKSPHAKNGSFWRSYSFDTLIGSDAIIQKAIENFEQDSSLGVQAGFKNIFSFKRWGLGSNKEEMEKLSTLIGIKKEFKKLVKYCKEGQLEELDDYEDNLVKFNKNEDILEEEFIFPAGTMFWFKPEALNGLFSIGIGTDDFPPEQGQLDGTMAHAIERMVGLTCKANNYKIGILK